MAIRKRGNGTLITNQTILRKKSVAVGWILLILGLIGVVLALIIYPTWQDNKDRLQYREYYGVATDDDYAVVGEQTILVLGGLLYGTPILLGGAYLVATRSSYNRKLDDVMIQKAMQPSQMYQPLAPGTTAFCANCGASMPPGYLRCPNCGRSTEGPVAPSSFPTTSAPAQARPTSPSQKTPLPSQAVPPHTLVCPHCGVHNPDSFEYCYSCAKVLRPQVVAKARTLRDEIPIDVSVICPKCGAKNNRTERVCANCDGDLTEVKKLLAKKYANAET
jgi:ribosomal protein L40E